MSYHLEGRRTCDHQEFLSDHHHRHLRARRDRRSARRPAGRRHPRPGTPIRPRYVDGEVGGLPRAPTGRTARRLGGLGAEAGRILTGTSAVAPHRGDRRLTDDAGDENPLLKRMVQLYLASGQTVEQLVIDANIEPRDRKRVRFFLENLIQATAPSKIPLVNPSSAKAVIDTAGLNLVRGAGTRQGPGPPPRIPEMVDRSPFEVGGNIAATPGAVVFRNEVLELIQYEPQTDEVHEVPVLVVPPQINKFYALDLAPGRSLVECAVRQGPQMFVISWRNPTTSTPPGTSTRTCGRVLDALDAVGESRAASGRYSAACAPAASSPRSRGYLAATAGSTGWPRSAWRSPSSTTTIRDGPRPSSTSGWRAGQGEVRAKGYLDGRALAEVFAWLRPTTWCGTTG